ncbi:alpha/beta hydrolase family protein [Ancylobacter polymorphus]|uniref:Pimeloyl-ACP methyl ester carboxylesterase n=1 Tax=Ancylobacter polymorphus TaxID=223390 RepID=A0ABU0BCJ2_9HYPH|nr:alpha/beta hydrolase [Ancylobacter polymorphus]MDQ0303558.1 pimeloyl-ACP methyl ester carboxylesterase [Ancylobacter polymorphus]
MRKALFRSENIEVVKVSGGHTDVVFVTFEPKLLVRPPERSGFGEAFFAKRGYTAYHVRCRGNDWYHYPDMEAGLAALRADIPPATRVVLYGSSMGGYAALRFSNWLRADAVIALAPQASVDPTRVGWEKRWAPETSVLIWDRLPPHPNAACYVVYDPFDADRRHVAILRREAALVPLHSYFSGHHVTEYLMESGLLESLLVSVARGEFDPPAWQAELWRRRLMTSYYSVIRLRKCRTLLRRWRYDLIERWLDLRYRRVAARRPLAALPLEAVPRGD